MSNKTYILLKDLPNVKAGAEFDWNNTETWIGGPYKGGRYVCQDTIYCYGMDAVFAPKEVENNPDWFKLKEENRYKVLTFHPAYPFKDESINIITFNRPIPFEKREEIKTAVDLILNKQ